MTELARAVAAADRQFYRLCAANPDATIHSTSELTWFSLGTQVAVETLVVHGDWARPGAERVVSELVGAFRTARQPFVWTVHAASRPAELGRLLASRGLGLAAHHVGMYLDLHAASGRPSETHRGASPSVGGRAPGADDQASGLDGPRVSAPMPGLGILLARTHEQVSQYADIVVEVFGSTDSWRRGLLRAHMALGVGTGAGLGVGAGLGLEIGRGFASSRPGPAPHPCPGPWQVLIGVLDGRPVGAACVTLCSEVAAIHNLGVLPAARGRGVGAALTVRACEVARQSGHRYVVLTATPQGHRLYRALGFIDCGPVLIYVDASGFVR